MSGSNLFFLLIRHNLFHSDPNEFSLSCGGSSPGSKSYLATKSSSMSCKVDTQGNGQQSSTKA